MNEKPKKQRVRTVLRNAWKPLIALLGLIVMIVWTTGALKERVAPEAVAFEPGFALPEGAELHTVRREPLARRIDIMGTVVPEEIVQVSARLNAHVTEVFVSAGDRVEEGQQLLSLDDREVREQRAAAEAQARLAETEYERARTLHERQASTAQQLTAAESAFHTARARLEQIDVQRTFTEIRAPMAGVVTDRRIEPGDLAHPGQVLLAVYNPEAMRLEVPVPVRLVDLIPLDAEVRVALERPAGVYQGRVAEKVSEIDPATRTQRVKVQLPGSGGAILPGAFGRVQLTAGAHDGVRVPVQSVYRVGQLEMMQVVQGSRVVRRLVRTGPVDEGMVEILAGLDEGEQVLLTPVMENL